jgi:hypothetical protein
MEKENKNWRSHKDEIKREVRAKTIGYMLAAFGLVAGLAWNDAITAIIKEVFPAGDNTIMAKVIYAVVVTVLVVVISMYLGRLSATDDKK